MGPYDAWEIFGNTGLLEINNPGHQNFSVTLDQYDDGYFPTLVQK